MEQVTAVPAKPPRHAWADIAKAIAILMVVWNHAATGVTQYPLPGHVYSFTQFVHLFNLSTFFFVAGLVVLNSVQKPFDAFFWRLLRLVYYPMVLWSILQGTLYSLAGSNVEEQIPIWEPLVTSWYDPHKQMGFLMSIIAGRLIFYAAGRLNIPWWGVGLFAFFVSVLYAISWASPFYTPIQPAYLLFMALGAGVGATGLMDAIGRMSARTALLYSVVGFALAILLFNLWPRPLTSTYFSLTLIRLLGMTGVVFLAIALSKVSWTGWLVYIGQRSLPIFVAHLILTGGLRIFLIKFLGFDDAMLIAILCFLLGIIGPLVALHLFGRDWLFQIPANFLKGRTTRGDGSGRSAA